MLERLEGIILRTQNYGETHKIVTIFTKEKGILTSIARGANKGKSKLSALSQPFIQGQFLIYLSKGLSTLQQGETLHAYRSIREDIVKTAYAAYLAELTNRSLNEKERYGIFYKELKDTFNWINDHESYAIPIMMYELKMFQYGGYAPVVDQCVNCSNQTELKVFSINEGGVLCVNCAHIDEHSIVLGPKLIYILQIMQSAKLSQVGEVKMKDENILLLRKVLDEYYEKYGGLYLKSKRFLTQLDSLM